MEVIMPIIYCTEKEMDEDEVAIVTVY